MIYSGIYNKLTVNRISEFGLYLADEEGNEVLLPNRYTSIDDKVGDEMEVFVYHDSEDRLVATTEHPLAKVGEVVYLKVVDKTVHGAFLEWGLEARDLFLPNSNMIGHVEAGGKYVVYVYRDNVTDRVVTTMLLKSFINNEELDIRRGDEVEIVVAHTTDQGYRVVINNRFWGMIYDNQLFKRINIGDRLTAYVRRITEDSRVDLSLQQEGYDQVKVSADKIMEMLESGSGFLPLNDFSDPHDIRARTKMSKKVFKRVLGYLMKRNLIEQTDKGIKLVKKE